MDKVGPPPGYPKVAEFMGKHPEMAMVRRFRGLNARNLLYLQAELVEIERKLLECERHDADDKTDPRKPKYAGSWARLVLYKTDDSANQQYKLILEMREKLKEYNDVLIQQTTLAQISKPSEYDSKVLQQWFVRRDLGNMPIFDDSASTWANPLDDDPESPAGVSNHLEDMIAINEPSDDLDSVTNWVMRTVLPNYHEKVARHFRDGETTYRETTWYRVTSILATTLSTLLPILSIVVLYIVHNMPARLGIIAAFTASFSFILNFITKASRVDNFAATAAFAAVQVVFVGNGGPTGNSTSS